MVFESIFDTSIDMYLGYFESESIIDVDHDSPKFVDLTNFTWPFSA